MMKMINSTNARSSSGVMLMSLSVTSELRCENRRMNSILKVLGFHFGNHFLREVVQLDREGAQIVSEPVVTKHRRNRDKQSGNRRDERRRRARRHGGQRRAALLGDVAE